MGNKSVWLKVRIDPDFKKEIDEWLDIHTTFNMSELVRDGIKLKMKVDTPVTSQLEEVELIINNRFDSMVQVLEDKLQDLENKVESGEIVKRTKKPKLNLG